MFGYFENGKTCVNRDGKRRKEDQLSLDDESLLIVRDYEWVVLMMIISNAVKNT